MENVNPTAISGAKAIDRALRLLRSITEAEEDAPLSAHARRLSMPASTAHRLAEALAAHGLLHEVERGHYLPGLGLGDLASGVDPGRLLARAGRPVMRSLARAVGPTVHLGVMAGDMVTYVVKEPGASPLLTREGGQLEAYCSAIGKVILAGLSDQSREEYLRTAPFVALTDRTITTREALGACLEEARRSGYAVDEGEVLPDLHCIAVPIRRASGVIVGAISHSRLGSDPSHTLSSLEHLRQAAAQIGANI